MFDACFSLLCIHSSPFALLVTTRLTLFYSSIFYISTSHTGYRLCIYIYQHQPSNSLRPPTGAVGLLTSAVSASTVARHADHPFYTTRNEQTCIMPGVIPNITGSRSATSMFSSEMSQRIASIIEHAPPVATDDPLSRSTSPAPRLSLVPRPRVLGLKEMNEGCKGSPVWNIIRPRLTGLGSLESSFSTHLSK